jgi:16S rRNA (uracil1498-N3)-methyltransferase
LRLANYIDIFICNLQSEICNLKFTHMHFFLLEDFNRPILTGDEHRHLSRVLRLAPGASVLLSAGDGRVQEAVIEDVGREETRCRVTALHEEYHESPIEVILLQGILKNHGKLDWLVEKGTELGMRRFIPMITERCVSQSVKQERLQKLALAAMKQCQRGRIPEVGKPQHLSGVTGNLTDARLLLFHESASAGAVPETLVFDQRPLALFVGPEGGFSEDEVDLLREKGADVLSLGPRRLRGETAGLAALARVAGMIENSRLQIENE